MAIDVSFYKNVSLLMQVVPASFECTKHFKKGMFDKPNTLGFIHISHYLLSVYDAKHFQKMVAWPILNKTDEKRYRTEVRDFLEILAKENLDVKFPPIQMSHLLQAGGVKFSILMWKISVTSLRAYVKRKYPKELLQAPNADDTRKITQKYFTSMNTKQDITLTKFYEKTKSVLETFERYMQHKCSHLKKMQAAIFEVKESIEESVPMLPVSPLIANRLTDVEDGEIVNSWKMSIKQNIQILSQRNLLLRKLQTLSSRLSNLISDLCIHSKFFDGNDLPKINSELLPLCLTNNKELVNYGLYKNGCLTFHVLLSLLDQALKQVESYLKMDELSDLSSCEPQIIQHCAVVKSMEETFQKLITQVSDNLYDVLCGLQEKTMNCTLETDFLYPMCLERILISPKINLSICEYTIEEKLSNSILTSPLSGKYTNLFKRYKRNLIDSSIMSAAKYQPDDNIESILTKWRSPRRQSLIYKKNSPNKLQVSSRYSRLFCTNDSKRNHFKDNNAASTPNQCRRNLTPKNLNMQDQSTPLINIDEAMKNIFDLSCKITDVVASLSKS